MRSRLTVWAFGRELVDASGMDGGRGWRRAKGEGGLRGELRRAIPERERVSFVRARRRAWRGVGDVARVATEEVVALAPEGAGVDSARGLSWKGAAATVER